MGKILDFNKAMDESVRLVQEERLDYETAIKKAKEKYELSERKEYGTSKKLDMPPMQQESK